MRRAVIFAAGTLLLVGLWRIAHPTGEIGTDLLFGWIAFLQRVLPNVTLRWDGLLTFAMGLVGVTVIAHGLVRWMSRHVQARRPQPHIDWRFRSTILLVGMVVLLFVAGISMIGVTHQTVWLVTSGDPLLGKQVNNRFVDHPYSLRAVGLAIDNTAVSHGFPNRAVTDADGAPQSWVLYILPYLGYQPDGVDFSMPWNHPDNEDEFKRLVPELINPTLRNAPFRHGDGFGLNHYAGNRTLFDWQEPLELADLPDTSNLLMIGEVNSELIAWGHPDNSRDPAIGLNASEGFGGPFGTASVHFVMADGSVRVIANDVDPEVLRRLSEFSARDRGTP